MEQPAPRITAGSVVQQYEVIRLLGQGGMGEVFLARDTRLGRLVAIKLLTEHSGERAQRFLIEARATAQLSHENIVVVHELGEHRGAPYMVLEYLKGKTLQQLLHERRDRAQEDGTEGAPPAARPAMGLSPNRAIELMIPVVRALVCAHARGIVHRDLKPSNIMVTDAGCVKVLDFGLAKLLGAKGAWAEAEADRSPRGAGAEEPLGLTAAGKALGTLPYMSPEQWRADRVDHRADIWAVGMVLAELVLGRHPLAPLSPYALATISRIDMPMPSLRELCPEIGRLGSIIDRCLLKRLEDRLGSARELCDELSLLAPATRPSEASSGDVARNPYAGLSAFREGDAARFFGRASVVAEAIALLAEQPLLLIVGPSGAGKSSFVRAGVIPALDRSEDAWEAFMVRPGPHPLTALAELLLSDTLQTSSLDAAPRARAADGPADREGLAARLHAEPGALGARMRAFARRRRKRVLLFVDQAEELYTLSPEPDRAAFFACLAGIADDIGSPLRAVLAIRSDFLDRMAEARAAVSALGRGILLLPPMDREGLREALVRPLEAVEHRFEPPGLVDEMVEALAHTAAALPLLSFTASRLWDQRDRARRLLTEESYRQMGGIGGALAGHADAVLAAMPPEERALARTALLRLVTPERTRALCAVAELRELGAQPREMDQVLGRLTDARLLTVMGGGGADATVEIVHESLITRWPTLSGWLVEHQDDAAFLARLRNAAREWEAGGRSEDLLWRGQAAEGARRWQARDAGDLGPLEERYLRAVVGLLERARRLRTRVIASVIGALTMIALVVSGLAIRASRAADRAQDEARQARNATRMAAARERIADPTTVLALLREIEPPDVPRGWSDLSRWALYAGVARAVLNHPDAVTYAAYSPDGTRIVTASQDRTARVWSADGTGEPIVLRGHEDVIRSAAFSPDGKRIVTASWDRTARVWSADGKGEPIVLRGHEDIVWSAAWSPDGKHIVTASSDRTARVWSADGTGEPIVLRGHEDIVRSAAFSPDGTRVVTASSDKTARMWSADGKGELMALRGHPDGVASAAFSPDSKHIVTASNDKTVRVWSADGQGDPLVLRGHEDMVWSAAYSPDGRRIVSASADKTARVWSADGTGEPTVLRGHEDMVWSASFSADGERIVTASLDRTARVWSAGGTSEPAVLRGHEAPVVSAAFSPDGKRLVTASWDKTARVWSADDTGEPLTVLRGHEGGLWSAAWSPDGTHIVTASQDKTARVWSADGTGEPLVLRGHEGAVWSAAWSPDGTRIVTASQDKTARVWSADGTGEPLVLRGHEGAVWSAAWSPDGKRIVTASQDRTARVWSADGAGAPRVLRGHEDWINAAAWSPDGTRIVTASRDKTARVWSADGAGAPLVLAGHEHWVNGAAWSPDGKRIVTASQDRTVRVWNADGTGEPLVLRGAAAAYNSAAFSPDGSRVVAASDDKTIAIWTDLEPLHGAADPRLWAATSACMPAPRRMKILGVPAATAEADQEACLRKVDAARAAAR